ncbi:MAG: hypothetical protein K5756_06420 [Clostridiales bacterium]|nr:hypothetical protein [Clostridiales bacterium]
MKRAVKYVKRAVSLIIISVMLFFVFSGCSGNGKTCKTYSFPESKAAVHYAEVEQKSLHFTDPGYISGSLQSSGLLSLYIDKSSYSIVVREGSTEKNWYTLPIATAIEDSNCDYSAAAVTLKVVSGADIYYLNSQDNSVAYGTASYDTVAKGKSKGIAVKYIIAPDKQTATKSSFGDKDIAFEVILTYMLKDGNLYVTAKHKNLTGNKDVCIEDMGVLEFFGANRHMKENKEGDNDFILVPDGSGALIYTDIFEENFQPVELAVYGEDYALTTEATRQSACIAAYGARQGNGAFAAIIEKGDAIATIKADRQSGKTGFNIVGASFKITPVMSTTTRGTIKQCVAAESYNDEIRLCYKFFSGSTASYSSIAVACREQLIRNNVLSTKTVDADDKALPFNLSLIGAVPGGRVKSLKYMTTFSEAIDMLEQIKAKGIDNINVRYTGIMSGGVNQTSVLNSRVLSGLGGKDDLQRLYEYMSSKKMGLYIDVNLITSNVSHTFKGKKAATALNGDKSYGLIDNKFYKYLGGSEQFKRSFLGLSRLEDSVITLLNNTRKMNYTGFCINDCGSLLYSDYSGKTAINRQAASEEMFKQLIPLSTNKSVMVNTGNFYALRGADYIINIPLGTQRENSPSYVAIPFLQMILHGTADYSGTPINEADNEIKMALKYIEYGACPSYEWSYSEMSYDETMYEPYFFSERLADGVKFYQKANEALADLRSSRIVNHYMISNGFYCTEYGDGAVIYVNYNDAPRTINGLTVEAEDFLRIN